MTYAKEENIKPTSKTKKVIPFQFLSKEFRISNENIDGHILITKTMMELSERKNNKIHKPNEQHPHSSEGKTHEQRVNKPRGKVIPTDNINMIVST